MMRLCLELALLFVLLAGVVSGDWLTEGSADYSEIRSHFTDPIFTPGARDISQFYPYFGEEIFTSDTPAPRNAAYYYPYFGSQFFSPAPNTTGQSLLYLPYPYTARQSEFRTQALANLQWTKYQKNWTETMEFGRNRSSFRVYQNGKWITV